MEKETLANSCEECDGRGAVLGNDSEGYDEIQRCDTCEVFVADTHAVVAVWNLAFRDSQEVRKGYFGQLNKGR